MRQITLVLIACFFASTITNAQTELDQISSKISEVFQKTKAVKELAANKKIVLGQLQDLKKWQAQALLSSSSTSELEVAYTAYANAMNSVADEISADLNSLSRHRDLKGVRFDKFIKKFEKKYNEHIVEAYTIYNTAFLPNFEQAATDANSKVGIIGSIALILEFGDTIFGAIKSIFSKDGLSRSSKDTLIELSVNLVAKNISKQLRYPSWGELGMTSASILPENTTFSRGMHLNNSANRIYTHLAPLAKTSETTEMYNQPEIPEPKNRETLQNTIGLTYFGTQETIGLENISKGIIVGNNEPSTSDMTLFTTAAPMNKGDKFWVALGGHQYAQFYYYEQHSQSWQDPFGKGIIVGGASKGNDDTVLLPSNTSYFEITDDTAQEQFFVLLSNQPISDIIKTGIIGGAVTGVSFLTALNTMIPLRYPKVDLTTQKLILPSEEVSDTPTFYGVYITIEKVNTQ